MPSSPMPKLNFVNAVTSFEIADRRHWMPFPVANLPARCTLYRRVLNGVVEYQLDPFERGARPVEGPAVASYAALRSLSSSVPELREATMAELYEVADPGETAIGIALDRNGEWLLFVFPDPELIFYGPLAIHDDILRHHFLEDIADLWRLEPAKEVSSKLLTMFRELSNLHFGLLYDLNSDQPWGVFDSMGRRINLGDDLETMVKFVISGDLRSAMAEAGRDVAELERVAMLFTDRQPSEERSSPPTAAMA